MTQPLSYALVTPARNEGDNLQRIASCMVEQTITPSAWIIVDNGSTDNTFESARALAVLHDWIRLHVAPGEATARRGGPIVRAFQAGLAQLTPAPDVVVKLDADVSFAPDYFERLLAEFSADPSLGIASGTCYEKVDGSWRAQYVTRSHVRGATRAYRWQCLQQVLPLEERMGWDGIDEIKANVRGWRTAGFRDLPFYHHRRLGERDGRHRAWIAHGQMAYYMGYRPSYLILRAVYRMRREPAAVAMIWAYAAAALARQPRCPDEAVRVHLRREQSARRLPLRIQEALGRRITLSRSGRA
jgi:biofilm PGA synthesis N-glycosyltransferase PgaC